MSEILKTLRKVRIGPLALFDTAGTVGGALWISNKYKIAPINMVIGSLLLGEAVHLAFKISTPISDFLTSIDLQ